MAKFGRAVVARRKEMKMSGRALERAAGISHGMMCHIEKGENYPSLQVYLKLCKALGYEAPPMT